jgi:hypothetical protein
MKLDEIEPRTFSDDEINEVADWLNSLTFDQLYFLKGCYEEMLKAQAKEQGHEYVH